ncbi:hypothetical protein [Shewanella maritima]|uniref:hypothetical protein n=1 Tax=Shewanella maritima TaxID=2520507 RepID=UPI003735388F
MLDILKKATPLLLLAPIAQAEVLKQSTSVSVGWNHEMGDKSEASNKFSQPVLALAHLTQADWGTVFVGGQIDNIGQMQDDVSGNPGSQSFKAYTTLNYNLGDSGFKLWYDGFAVGSLAMFEMTNYLGLTYAKSFGKLRASASLGGNYVFGHAGTSDNQVQGFESMAYRLTANYRFNKHWSAFAKLDGHFNRSDDYQNTYRYQDSGKSLNTGVRYDFSNGQRITLNYGYRDSWAGYNEGGNFIRLSYGYQF